MPDEKELVIQEIQANVVEIAALQKQLDEARVDDPDASRRVTIEGATTEGLLNEIQARHEGFVTAFILRKDQLAQLEALRQQRLAEVIALGGAP